MQTLQQLKNGELKGITSLKLSEELSNFPPEIFELADTLEKLDLSFNKLKELPADFGRLKKLKILFCSENLFTELPEVLGDCPLLDIVGFKSNFIETVPPKALNANLRWLILTNNRITEIPAQIGNCSRMQKLMLAGNCLTELPIALSNCRNLGLLRISANRLNSLPQWLLEMPKLAWLAFSGNEFNVKPDAGDIPSIDYSQLEIMDQLGEGASGIILKANLQTTTEPKQVAVKIFKGAVTSDGLPDDEMQTFIAAGKHSGLVNLLGKITGHPDDKQGLVMDLIPPNFFNLGNPPSFTSCTRDVFDEEIGLSAWQIRKIAGTVASLMAQLHTNGIMHGDLYAHNTLIDADGNALFGDFGAASFYDRADKKTTQLLQKIEVQAFGYLMDDLIGLSNQIDPGDELSKLKDLRDTCLSQDILSRPDFGYLADALK